MYEHSDQLEVEERYRFLAENVRDVIFIQDMDLNIIYVSPSVTDLFGLTVDETLKVNLTDYMTPDSFERGVRDFQKYAPLAQNGRDVHIPLMEYEYIRKDGSTFWGELKLGFIYDPNGNPTGMQGVLRNIDERKRMLEALQESESMFRTIFDLSPQAIALSELETGKLREVNQTFCELTQFARQDVVGKTTTELGFYSVKDRGRFINELKTHGEVHSLEMDFKARDGSILKSLMFSKVISLARKKLLLTIFLDMTEHRRLEAQLRHAHKMEAVGTLAGGIAHDFNNLLQAVLGYTQILLMERDPSSHDYEKLAAIEKMARRGGDLSKRLLIYARRVESKPKPLNINQEIVQTCKVLERTMPKMIDINLHLAEDISIVSCDPAELQQIIMNLSVNATDAMPDGGHLSIETENVFLDGSYCRNNPGASEGVHVLMRLSDTGCGINEEVKDHIFEPFFTTKEVGKGTGLGLPMVYGLVKAQGGYITCESDPGRGTTFRTYFPVPHSEGSVVMESPQMGGPMPGGVETVLVVDDEETVRLSTRDMLKHFGYTVVLAENGEKALETYKGHAAGIDLVILDLSMPGMGGHQCARELTAMDPDVTILIASGHSPSAQEKDLVEAGAAGFISKPYQVGDLMRKVRLTLDGKNLPSL